MRTLENRRRRGEDVVRWIGNSTKSGVESGPVLQPQALLRAGPGRRELGGGVGALRGLLGAARRAAGRCEGTNSTVVSNQK